MSAATVQNWFAHLGVTGVERYYLPGSWAYNFLLRDVLGGGGIASLRNDPQGKSFAQMLLDVPVPVPDALISQYGLEAHVLPS